MTSLCFDCERLRVARLLKQLEWHTTLTSLTLDTLSLRSIHVPLLARLTQLRRLEFRAFWESDATNDRVEFHLRILTPLTNLTSLNIGGNILTPDDTDDEEDEVFPDLQPLASLPLLRVLEMSNMDLIANEFPYLESLTSLNLDYNIVYDYKGIWSCSNLTSLSLACVGENGGDGRFIVLSELPVLPSLKLLNLNENCLTPEDIPVLALYTSLTSLSIANCIKGEDLTPLVTLPSLTELDLFHCEVSDETIAAIIANSKLRSLNLGLNQLQSEQVLELANNHNTLESLDLKSNNLMDDPLSTFKRRGSP